MATEVPTNPRILIIKLSSLGDIMHTMPVVDALARQLQPSCIHWVAQPEYHDLIRCSPHVERTIPYFRRSFFRSLGPWMAEMRREQYDLVLDLQGLFKSAMCAWFSRSARRIGPARSREGSRLFYHDTVPEHSDGRHAVDISLDVLDYLGLSRGDGTCALVVPPASLNSPRPRVAIAPFSRHAYKNWPEKNFTELAKQLQEQDGASILLVGSAADEASCAAMCTTLNDRAENLAGRTSIVELASILSEVDVLISNDSGPMHLASAVGTPVLGIFTGTDPRRYGPYGGGHEVLSAMHDDDLSVEGAAGAVRRILGRTG